MSECCRVISEVSPRQRRMLRVVLGVNVAMFLVEAGAGLVADSTALLADSADMLGDAFVYGVSLYAVGRGAGWGARAATLKGWLRSRASSSPTPNHSCGFKSTFNPKLWRKRMTSSTRGAGWLFC